MFEARKMLSASSVYPVWARRGSFRLCSKRLLETEALDRHRAIYADLAESSTPPAREVLEDIVADGQKAVLVLDNCPSAAHRNLASIAVGNSNVRLLTIEHDIRKDSTEFTDVVRIRCGGFQRCRSTGKTPLSGGWAS